MKAIVIETFCEAPKLATVADPIPDPDGVVLSVGATGVCRSDWHGWMGHDPDIPLPHVPGHEFAGTIEAVGRNVTRWRAGDRVTAPFISACGACPECHAGHQQVCVRQSQPGFTHWGSFAEYVVVKQADLNLIALPEDMGFDTAASLGCRFATAFRAVVDQGGVRPGEWVAVHGCGGVGLSAIMIARAMGGRVVGVDIAGDKLALARQIGAEATIDATQGPVPDAMHEITQGGAHVSVDALGHPQTCADAIRGLRRRGRHVQVGLLLAEHAMTALPMDRVIGWELEIKGSHGMQAHRYDAMLALISSGQLAPEKLIGARIPLSDGIEALTTMDRFSGLGATVITSF